MLHRLTRRLAILLLALGALPARADERLVLVGGGEKPQPALERFALWAGGGQARILVVLWSTSEPQENLEWLRGELAPFGPASVEGAPLAPLDASKRQQLLEQLAKASGVFFSGGDQGRVMDVFLPDRPLLEAFKARHREGVVFGGTSAGTAIMSRTMITGDGDFTVIDAARVQTREGLGLLPGVILDQHFVKRQRENRLFALVLAQPDELGVGIDEDAALLVRGARHAEVAGGIVIIVDGRARKGDLVLTLLAPGDRYDLVARKRE